MNAIIKARYNLAIAYLNDAQYNEAISEFQAAIKLDSDFVDAHCGLSRTFIELNDLDRAEASVQKAIRLDAGHPSALSLIDVIRDEHYENGVTFMNDKQYREAVRTFQKVISLDGDYKQTSYNLGLAYIELNQFREAITSLETAIDNDSALDDVHYHIGCAYIEQRQFDKAIQHLEQAIDTEPNLKEAHYNLARAYRETGNLEAATNAVTETLRLDPNYKPVHDLVETIKQTHYNRGISFLNSNRYSDAIAAFHNVITLDPDFTAAHFNLGVAYLKLENHERAIDVLQRTTTLDRTHKAAFHALALAYFAQHELENARNAAKDALAIDPNYQPAKSLLEAIDPSFEDVQNNTTIEPENTSSDQDEDISDIGQTEEKQDKIENTHSIAVETDTPDQETTEIQKDLERGLIYLNNRQYNNAVAAYKRAIKADPTCIDAHYGLGQTYLEIAAFDNARLAADEALKLNPRHQPSLELLQTIKYLVNLEKNRKMRKKVLIYASIVLIAAVSVFAMSQYGVIFNSGRNGPPTPTPPPKPKPPNPATPVLSIKSSLDEPSGNGLIDAGEIATLKLTIMNSGGYANNIKVRITPRYIDGLVLKDLTQNLDIRKEKRISVLEIRADDKVKGFEKTLKIQLLDRNGKQLITKDFKIKTLPKLPDPIPVR